MIINKKEFCIHIEEEFSTNNMSLIDNVLTACNEFNVDPDMVEPLINRSIKEKIKEEYIELNYLKADTNTLF